MSAPAQAPDIAGAWQVADGAAVDAAYGRLITAVGARVDGAPLTLLGILLGGALPLARLATGLRGDFVLDTCRVSRYRDQTRGGAPDWLCPPQTTLAGRHVVLVDDIHDEGLTLAFVAAHCRQAGATVVTTAVLVKKRHGRAQAPPPDCVGLEVDDHFVFGAGMDHRGRWRHLPGIWALPAAHG